MLGGLIINMAKHEVLTKCHPKMSPVIVGLEICGTKNLKTTTENYISLLSNCPNLLSSDLVNPGSRRIA